MLIHRLKARKQPAIYKILNLSSPSQDIRVMLYESKKAMVYSYYVDNKGICLYSGAICKMLKSTYKSLSRYRVVRIWANNNVLCIGVMLT